MTFSVVCYLLFLFFSLVFVRMNTTYHPNLIFKKHIVIHRPTLAKLLVANFSPVDEKKDIESQYRNKLLLLGIVFYVLWLALFAFSVVMLFFVPIIPTEPVEIFSDLHLSVSTLNEKFLWFLVLELDSIMFAFWCLNIIKCAHTLTNSKIWRSVWIGLIVLMTGIAIGFPIAFWCGF